MANVKKNVFSKSTLKRIISEEYNDNVSLFARKFGKARTTIDSWIDGAQPGSDSLFALAEFTGRNIDEFIDNSRDLENGEKEPPPQIDPNYQQPEEHILPRKPNAPDPDRGSYGIPDFERHKVVEPNYITMVRDILKGGHRATADALKSNIVEFYERIEDKKRILSLEKKIKKLEKGLQRAENFDCGSAETAENADRKS